MPKGTFDKMRGNQDTKTHKKFNDDSYLPQDDQIEKESLQINQSKDEL